MRPTQHLRILLATAAVLAVAFLAAGGCDIDFGTNDGSSASEQATLSGTITSVTPDRNLDGIRIEVTDPTSGIIFSDITDTDGTFSIEGDFSGTNIKLEFLDESSNQIALSSVTVYPGADVDLGSISITNGTVSFDDAIIVTLTGDVKENNCAGGSGTLVVTDADVDVVVEISASTLLQRDGDTIDCETILLGDTVETRGELKTGGAVDAFSVDLI